MSVRTPKKEIFRQTFWVCPAAPRKCIVRSLSVGLKSRRILFEPIHVRKRKTVVARHLVRNENGSIDMRFLITKSQLLTGFEGFDGPIDQLFALPLDQNLGLVDHQIPRPNTLEFPS